MRFEPIDDFINSTPKTPSFSYEDVRAAYQENDPGVLYGGFHNTSPTALESIDGVLERAQKECTVPYDTVDIAYDSTASMWQVAFSQADTAGGGQTVYMDSYGVTRLLVYGE